LTRAFPRFIQQGILSFLRLSEVDLQSITIYISDIARYRTISCSYLTRNYRDLHSFILDCCVQEQLYHPPQFVPHREPCLSVPKSNHGQLHIHMLGLHIKRCHFCQILTKIRRLRCILVEAPKFIPWESRFYTRMGGQTSHDQFYVQGFVHREYMSLSLQQDATICSLLIPVNCSTYFGWYLHPSSGAHIAVSTASGNLPLTWLAVPSQPR
jgi:hypothetical protein